MTSKLQSLISSDCLSPWRTDMNNVHIFFLLPHVDVLIVAEYE